MRLASSRLSLQPHRPTSSREKSRYHPGHALAGATNMSAPLPLMDAYKLVLEANGCRGSEFKIYAGRECFCATSKGKRGFLEIGPYPFCGYQNYPVGGQSVFRCQHTAGERQFSSSRRVIMDRIRLQAIANRNGGVEPRYLPSLQRLYAKEAQLERRLVLMTVLKQSPPATLREAVRNQKVVLELQKWLAAAAEAKEFRLAFRVIETLDKLPIDLAALQASFLRYARRLPP